MQDCPDVYSRKFLDKKMLPRHFSWKSIRMSRGVNHNCSMLQLDSFASSFFSVILPTHQYVSESTDHKILATIILLLLMVFVEY